MNNTTINEIKKQIQSNPILLYMKGSPEKPNCGFSAQAVKILSIYDVNFEYIDVLKNLDIRTELPKFANWPTFPQLWVNGELIGGCDILVEMHHKGELKQILHSANSANSK